MLRNGSISTEWTAGLAYVIGVITSDGNLSSDGRHISITSKDKDMLLEIRSILKIENMVGRKSRALYAEKKYFVLQFGSVHFYAFILSIGLTPAKSKTLGPLKIPTEYFFDFLRGCIDGDGCIAETTHPESKQVQLRISLCSASITFLKWIHENISEQCTVSGGWIYTSPMKNYSLLHFGKADSITLLNILYKNKDSPRLNRKFAIAQKYLDESLII